MTKIIQISDPHIVPEGERAYGKVDTAEALRNTVATINRLLEQIGPVDMVFVTGDLTEHGTADEYRRFREIMADLQVPYRAVPGNHDRRAPMLAELENVEGMPRGGFVNWTAEFANFAVIGLDSLTEGRAHGTLAPETVGYLMDRLGGLGGKPALVGLHHPPFATGIRAMDLQNLRDATQLAEALSACSSDIRLIFGHVHRAIAGLFAGRFCQICPGTSHAVTLDQRSGAPNSLTVEPGAAMLHEWRDGGFLSHLIPVGTYDGPYPFLGVD